MNPAIEPTQPAVLLGKFPYGWEAKTASRPKRDPVTGLLMMDKEGKTIEEILPFPRYYRKQFTHPGGTIIVGAPKRGGFWDKFDLQPPVDYDKLPEDEQKRARVHYRRCLVRKNQCKETRYIVWGDRSLRRVDRVLRKQFEGMTPDEQNKMIAQATGKKVQ